jgi:hypothetical protein
VFDAVEAGCIWAGCAEDAADTRVVDVRRARAAGGGTDADSMNAIGVAAGGADEMVNWLGVDVACCLRYSGMAT